MKITYAKPRKRNRPTAGAVTLSASMHMAIVALAWASSLFLPEPLVYETISIQIVEDAPVQGPEPEEEPAPPVEEEVELETPEEPPPEETPPDPEEEEPPPPETTPEEPEPEPEPEPTTDPEAERTDGPSGEDLDVRLEGLRRDFPEYYANIIRQITRCFRPPPGRHSATVQFTVHRDGTVSGIDAVESTGSIPFEIAAIEAVECAGRGRFGPLPDAFAWDALPIQFTFDPQGGAE